MNKIIRNNRNRSAANPIKIATLMILGYGIVIQSFAGPLPGLELVWPVPGATIGQDYAQLGPIGANTRHHSGIDIAAARGTTVIAAVSAGTGTIALIAELSDPLIMNKTNCLGNVVIVDHGSAYTLYAHLDSINDDLMVGSSVGANQQIGTVGDSVGLTADGTTPCATLPNTHLHFELKDRPELGAMKSPDLITWGYTPEPGRDAEPMPIDHPDDWGYHDPILNIGNDIVSVPGSGLMVTSLGNGLATRLGPGTNYSDTGTFLAAETTFKVLNRFASATDGCSAGWYQVANVDNNYFDYPLFPGGEEKLPEVWICAGNTGDAWVVSLKNLAQSCIASPALYIHDSSSNLGSVNVNTGAIYIIGRMSSQLTDIAFDASGELYGIDFGNLYLINPATAELTLIGAHGVAGANALVFSPTGALYMASGSRTSLYLVDPLTAAASVIGDMGFRSAGDLAFVDNILYLSSTGNDLIEVAESGMEPLGRRIGSIGFSNVFGLATAANGVLYGVASTNVFSVNLGSGTGSLVSNYGGQGMTSSYGSSFYEESGALDSDCDGLLDSWEIFGFVYEADGETTTIDFAAMGADPMRADVFVEVDYMDTDEIRPQLDAMTSVIKAFQNAPVLNPDGSIGIDLHIDAGPDFWMDFRDGTVWGDLSLSNTVPFEEALGVIVDLGSGRFNYSWDEFDNIKNGSSVANTPANFEGSRNEALFHYTVFANKLGAFDYSGIARTSGAVDMIASRDFILTIPTGHPIQQAGTFMHELGHNLGLYHGGGDSDQFKPNFISIMNYHFQLEGLNIDGKSGVMNYSATDTPSLNENDLDESIGLTDPDTGFVPAEISRASTKFFCDGVTDPISAEVVLVDDISLPINWDCDDNDLITAGAVSDLNTSGDRGELKGHNDWASLVFVGGASAGLSGGRPIPPPPAESEVTEAPFDVLRSIRKFRFVDIDSPSTASVALNGTFDVLIANDGARDETYEIEVLTPDGMLNAQAVEASVNIAAGDARSIQIRINGPSINAQTSGEVQVTVRTMGNEEMFDRTKTAVVLAATAPAIPQLPVTPPATPSSGGGGGGAGSVPMLLLLFGLYRRRLNKD